MCVKHANLTKPDLNLLQQRVAYNPETGELTWKPCGVELFKNHAGWARWHTKFANKPVLKRSRGYVVVTVTVEGKEQYIMGHRLAWAFVTGEWPEKEIDHINTEKADNRFCNLREATNRENSTNKGLSIANTSGIKGVYLLKRTGRWHARIKKDKVMRHLGYFETAAQAEYAYNMAAIQLHGEFARLNGVSK